MPSSFSSKINLLNRYLSCLENISDMCFCENQLKNINRQSTKSDLNISSKTDSYDAVTVDRSLDGHKVSLMNRLDSMTLPLRETLFKSGKSTVASELSTPVGEIMTGRSYITSCESSISTAEGSERKAFEHDHMNHDQSDDIENLQDILNKNQNELKIKSMIYIDSPPICNGYMAKLGQSFRSWKVRFFVLDNGIMTCYTGKSSSLSKGQDRNQSGECQVGSPLILRGYKVTSPAPNQLLISLPNHRQSYLHSAEDISSIEVDSSTIARQLLIKAMNEVEFLKWEKAINEHIKYINDSTCLA